MPAGVFPACHTMASLLPARAESVRPRRLPMSTSFRPSSARPATQVPSAPAPEALDPNPATPSASAATASTPAASADRFRRVGSDGTASALASRLSSYRDLDQALEADPDLWMTLDEATQRQTANLALYHGL